MSIKELKSESNLFKGITLITLIALIGAIIDTFMNFSKFPSKVPMHLGFTGQLGNYTTEKPAIFFFAIGGIFIFIILSVMIKYPSHFNYPVKITADNKERQQKLIIAFIKIVRIELALSLAYFQIALNRVVIAGGTTVGIVMPVFLTILTVTILIYFISARKIK